MCTNTPAFAAQDPAQYGLKRQIKKLERYLHGLGPVYHKNDGKADFISLTGGEPCRHPDFFSLLSYFRQRLPGVEILLLSNGRRFADKDFTRRFLKIAGPPFIVAVPVHGPSPRLHELVAGGRGAFGETIGGLRNLLAAPAGVRVEIRLVLHRLNIREFGKTLLFLRGRFPDPAGYRVVVIHYEIEGRSLKNHKLLALRLSDSARIINGAAGLINGFPDLSLYHFPLCLIKKELRSRCRITLPEEDRIYTEQCGGCAGRARCLGLMLGYYRAFGGGELKRLGPD
jgi:MoaA/NifB/PqqE/SkfB family radical SAM enzyme